MGKIAFVFPGQGAQSVGMGRDLAEQDATARRLFEEADEVLGFSLTKLMFEGPEEQLKQTAYTQPALLAASVAFWKAFGERYQVQADYVAGHSLGEYSALVAAGALSYQDALKTVRKRGELMEAAVPGGKGAMAAVLGAERDALSKLCQAVRSEGLLVELANLNCPGQIVVSGTKEGVQAVVERGKEAGAKRVIPLEVSGPFHSSLMKPASEQLEGVLAQLNIQPARIPVVANVTAQPVSDPGDIRRLLVQQVYASVLWEDSITWLIAQGVDTFIEFGSGTVLAGLIKKIDRSKFVHSIQSVEALHAFAQAH